MIKGLIIRKILQFEIYRIQYIASKFIRGLQGEIEKSTIIEEDHTLSNQKLVGI